MTVRCSLVSSLLILIAFQIHSEEPLSLQTRLEPSHLKAAHEARQNYHKAYSTSHIPDHGLYVDVRAVLNVRATNSVERESALEAARRSGVRVIMFTGSAVINSQKQDDLLVLNGREEDDGTLRFSLFPDNASGIHWGECRFAPPACDASGLSAFTGLQLCKCLNPDQNFNRCLESLSHKENTWSQTCESFRQYPDEFYAAGNEYPAALIARWDRMASEHPLYAIASNDAKQTLRQHDILFDPYEVNFRNLSTHLLLPQLNETEVRKALRTGQCYISHDWMCDPTGFGFAGVNNFGLFPMGSNVPYAQFMTGLSRVVAYTPVPAHLKLYHNEKIINEVNGNHMLFMLKEPGTYRLEAWLKIDGEERPWIYSNPVCFQPLSLEVLDKLHTPSFELSPGVTARQNLIYSPGNPDDENKHKLDLFIPSDHKRAPVFFFIHGGSWKGGDRSYYLPVGNIFAKKGILTVLPSYRLAPTNKHPAQIEDIAAAFAWVHEHIQEFGGDKNRIYVGGHSAGGHLAALLTLDERYLKKYGLSAADIRGTACLSGVYDILSVGDSLTFEFGNDKQGWRDASPLFHLQQGKVPPFLLTYCQWDYPTLPAQAKSFFTALQKAGGQPRLVFVPEENHISEMLSLSQDNDPTAEAVSLFIK